MCNALTVTKRESAPLPELLCERIAYCAILLTVYEADYSIVVVQSEGAEKAKNFAGGATDAIFSGRPVLINLMSDFVLDKTKATAEGRQWESYISERITNNAIFMAGWQCDQCGDLPVGCSWPSFCCDAFPEYRQVLCCLYSLRNCSSRKDLTSFSLCFCAISRMIFWINHFSGSGMGYPLLTVMRRSSSHHDTDSGYSDSLVLRRWRRLISPSSAETINCPVLSPASFKFSTASAIAWGTRASSFLDFPLTAFVAISDSLVIRWLTVYTQENGKTLLTWLTPVTNIVADTFIKVINEKTKPAGATNTNGLLTTNDSKNIEVAMLNHTTHPQGQDPHNLNKTGMKNQLIATASRGYDSCAPAKSGAGIGVLVFNEAHNMRPACFFVPNSHTLSMVGCTGAEKSAPGSSLTGYANPVQSTASEIGVSCGGFINPNEEAANMATTPTLIHSQSAFIWRFIALSTAKPRVIHIVATSEQEARQQSPAGCVMVFTARIRQGVTYA